MRLLLIHADNFKYRVTQRSAAAARAQEVPPDQREVAVSECLVAFIAVEKDDEVALNYVSDKAVQEIKRISDDLSVREIVIYPYAHLAPGLSSSSATLQALKAIQDGLRERAARLAPFGWYKSFEIECKGHPRSESYREISVMETQEGGRRGQEHPVRALNHRFRQIFLDLGLDEVINPCIVDEAEVYRQYGPEAPVILDRVFYLASLPRPDIGISQAEMEKITDIAPSFSDRKALEAFFREYKQGSIESDELTVEMASRLGLNEKQVIRILEEVFPQLRELEPVPSRKTLRSHMTSLWFPVMASLQARRTLPIRVFSIGPRYRREQREDARHLFESTTVSVAIMDRGFSGQDGQQLTREILGRLGFRDFEFRVKPVTSNYYASGTDTEVYVNIEGESIEVANFGFYDQSALSNYGISYPVFNLGFGSERLAMALEDVRDIRALVYPQFYEEAEFTDGDIARSLSAEEVPESTEGTELVAKLVDAALSNKSKIGPVEILAYEGDLLGAHLEVSVYNWDEGKSLLGQAATNEVYVWNSGVYGVPVDQLSEIRDFSDQPPIVRTLDEVRKRGTETGMCFVELMMQKAVAKIESAVRRQKRVVDMRIKGVSKASDINIQVPDNVEEYIQMRNKPIKIAGPIFAGVKARITYDGRD